MCPLPGYHSSGTVMGAPIAPPSPPPKEAKVAGDDHTLCSDAGSLYSVSNASTESFISYMPHDELPPFRLPKADGPTKEVYEAWTVYLSSDFDQPIATRKILGVTAVEDFDSFQGRVSTISELYDQQELADMHLKALDKYQTRHNRAWPSRLVRGAGSSYEDDIDARIRKLPNAVQSEISHLLADREDASSNRFHNRAWTVVMMHEQMHRRFADASPAIIDKRHKLRFWKNPGKNDRSEYFVIVRGREGRRITAHNGQHEFKRFENPWVLADEAEVRQKRREYDNKQSEKRSKAVPPPSYRYSPPPPPPPPPVFPNRGAYNEPGSYMRPHVGMHPPPPGMPHPMPGYYHPASLPAMNYSSPPAPYGPGNPIFPRGPPCSASMSAPLPLMPGHRHQPPSYASPATLPPQPRPYVQTYLGGRCDTMPSYNGPTAPPPPPRHPSFGMYPMSGLPPHLTQPATPYFASCVGGPGKPSTDPRDTLPKVTCGSSAWGTSAPRPVSVVSVEDEPADISRTYKDRVASGIDDDVSDTSSIRSMIAAAAKKPGQSVANVESKEETSDYPKAPNVIGPPSPMMLLHEQNVRRLHMFTNNQARRETAQKQEEQRKEPAAMHSAFVDYQMQLMLLEQQNKRRLLMAREEQDQQVWERKREGGEDDEKDGSDEGGSEADDDSDDDMHLCN